MERNGGREVSRVELWSCGGGRQSVLKLGLIKLGILPRPEHACMVDTNRERSSTWRYVNAVIRPECESLGVPFTVIDRSKYATVDLWSGEDGDSCVLPGYTTQGSGDGKLPEFCSNEWKGRVVMRWAREQAGWYERGVNCWIGFTWEERHRRRNSSTQWYQKVYPLLDVAPSHVSRVAEVCDECGFPEPVRSCCWMCPNMGNGEWATLRDEDPEDFARAVALEQEVQKRDPHLFLHHSKVPLAMADLTAKQEGGLFGGGCTSGMCY